MIDGKLRDTVIAVRELDLDGLPPGQRNWVNDHTVYTHGFGVVAAYGNQRGDDGQPVFFQQNIPPMGPLGPFEPRIYFGESSPDYSIVGGAQGRTAEGAGLPRQQRHRAAEHHLHRQRRGGHRRFVRRAAYAIKYRELNILLSDTVNGQSRILYDRTPRERVEKVAPWLTLDGDAYPAVVDGRVQWILDGYTTSAHYPYSRAAVGRRVDLRLADRALAQRAGDRRRSGQLHPQLGQGDGRRLQRRGQALRVGRPGPAAEGLVARRSPARCSRCRRSVAT